MENMKQSIKSSGRMPARTLHLQGLKPCISSLARPVLKDGHRHGNNAGYMNINRIKYTTVLVRTFFRSKSSRVPRSKQ